MPIGPYAYLFEEQPQWEQLPDGVRFYDVTGVAVDSADNVYVTTRSEHPVIVLDRDGRCLKVWPRTPFTTPHGIFIDGNDHVFIADDADHTVRVCDLDGNVLRTLGAANQPSETGFKMGISPVLHAGGPFNRVTNAATSRNTGNIYVADGYGNAVIHCFSPEGELIRSWGRPGSAPGEFLSPHGIGVDSTDRVYVADRENSRVQIFSSTGSFLNEWRWVNRPQDIHIDDRDHIFISESGWCKPQRSFASFTMMLTPPAGHDPLARVTVCDRDGRIISRIAGSNPVGHNGLVAPHGLCSDSSGDLYVAEAVHISGADEFFAPHHCAPLKKFKRLA